ncbi:uncharacterized protein LODBEIA_P49250 [Lodderomyces beijingensis]|uniref:Rhodanese domain-containing protein n=1 Tax=Lodderomyces beijingensis TaxID=1775926 RepID=A0ABP0ZU96_9ASCO
MTRTVSDLKTISSSTLHSWLLQGKSKHGKFQVVDVRDSDYVGGHIRSSYNYPAANFHSTLLELQQRLYKQQVSDVVFHCMLSQARGPKAALMFLRAIDDIADPAMKRYFMDHVHVYILKGGFSHWQGEYGSDPNVTEDYAADIWS